MKMSKSILIIVFAFAVCEQIPKAQNLYFPPISNNAFWDTISPDSLGWCVDEIQPLYDYLEQESSKGFIVLKDGKIVLEKYFGSFTKDSLWYWASAGKSLTALLVGQAQEDGFLSLDDKSSTYLGEGWTNSSLDQENKITIRNQITMTSGLDDGVPDNNCTIDTCLNFLADAGTRWSYHNGPYTLLEKVLEASTGQKINTYTQSRLKNKTGITGSWFTIGYDNVFFSRARSMARFGLLVQNNCIWNKDTMLKDQDYISQMTNTSQNLNLSYGYLWWLNGKPTFMVPGFQFVFAGPYAPAAPDDMYAGLGKNGQIVSVSPSKGIVLVRMGNQANSLSVPFTLCEGIWDKLNNIICNSTSAIEPSNTTNQTTLFSNLESSLLLIDCKIGYEIYNALGQLIRNGKGAINSVDVSDLPNGIYFIKIDNKTSKFMKY